MKKFFFLSLFLFFLLKTSKAEPPIIKAQANPTKTTIGQVIEYQINLAGPNLKNIKIILPEKKEFFLENPPGKKEEDPNQKKIPLYLIHNISKEDSSEKDLPYLSIKMKISFYHPGEFFLPEITFLGPDKIKIGYKIPKVTIEGLNPTGEFQDIEPPLSLKGNYYRLFFLISGIILFILLLFFLIKYWKKRQKEKKEKPIFIPAIKIFLKEMKKLNGEKLIRSEQIESFVVGISMIFRKFLSNLLSFDATEMTSDEIQVMIQKKLPEKVYQKYHQDIIKKLQLWDLAKFAEFTPSKEILLENLEQTLHLAKFLSMETEQKEPQNGNL